ncbi:MAG: hypothetical protein M1816_000469 [Peltula sp. TS41687]|nr:MAG: hypothetical protein M1816_000469 [Peltula sp. TS41687]
MPVEPNPTGLAEFFDYDLDVSLNDVTSSSDDEEEEDFFSDEETPSTVKEEEQQILPDFTRDNQGSFLDVPPPPRINAAKKETPMLVENDKSVLLRVSPMVSPDSLDDTEHTIFHAGDWALIALDDPEHHTVNEVALNASDQSDILYVQKFATAAPSGAVLAALQSSTVPGVTAGSFCSVKLRGSETYCRVWPVELDTPSCPGDSGAWILDASTGDLYGILFAACSALNMDYIMPIETIIQSIGSHAGLRHIGLPTLLNTFRIAMASNNKQWFQHLVTPGAILSLLKNAKARSVIEDYENILIWAAENGLVREVLELSEAYDSAIQSVKHPLVREFKSPALHAAARRGHVELVKTLLEAGADVNAKQADGFVETALQAASTAGHFEVVKSLLDAGADVNAEPADNYSLTLLQRAVQLGHVEVVEKLLEAGADVNEKPANNYGLTLLQRAVEGCHVEVVEKLLEAGIDVNAAWHGQSALELAIQGGHVEVVERLLASGVDVNAVAVKAHDWSALQMAAWRGHLDVVKMLLAAHADVNAPAADEDGRTALQAAAEGGHIEIVKTLLEAQANVNAAQAKHSGATALVLAVKGGNLEIVERLVEAGADINVPPGTETVLEAASRYRDTEQAKSLQPPFFLRLFDSVTTNDARTISVPRSERESTNVQTTPVHLLAASYRTEENTVALAKPDDWAYLRSELNVDRLNGIHDWLWIVGWPMPPRALHLQRMKSREIILTELMDLHLVWSPKHIYVKPIPRFLLDYGFWERHLCGNVRLYKCAMGFLLSYAALIQHESDYKIARETHLLPEELTWAQWILLVEQLLNCRNRSDFNKRYIYGELRLGRLNMIYRFRKGRVRGYLSSSTTYGDFFLDNLNSLLTLFAYTAVTLSAMQVGLSTDYLKGSGAFQGASYVFTIISIIVPLFSVTVLVTVFLCLFVNNLIATLMYRRKRFDALQGLPDDE